MRDAKVVDCINICSNSAVAIFNKMQFHNSAVAATLALKLYF